MNKTVKKYADNNDIKSLHYVFLDALDVSPTFEGYQEEWDYCKDIPGFLQEHEDLNTPLTNDKSKWKSMDYWIGLKKDLKKNFSLKRFNHMREVAKVLMSDKIERIAKEKEVVKNKSEELKTKSTTDKKETEEEIIAKKKTQEIAEKVAREKENAEKRRKMRNDKINLSNAFYEAVKNGQVRKIRIMLKDSLLVDPTFERFKEMERVASAVDGLYDVHDGRPFEENSELWDDDYMNKIMVQVVGNFSHERIEHLKKVVRKLRPIDGSNKNVSTEKNNKNSSQKSDNSITDIKPKQLISIATNLSSFTKPMRDAYSDIKILNSSLDKDDKIRSDVIQELHSYCINAISVYNHLSKICITSVKKNK